MRKWGKLGLYNSQKSWKGDITYICDRTGSIFREDNKVCKIYIYKNFCSELETMIY